MIPRSYPTLSPDHRTKATFDRIFEAIDALQRQPTTPASNGMSRLSQADVALIIAQLQSSGSRQLGAFAQSLIGDTNGDPLLSSLAQAPGTGTVTNLIANNSVSGLSMTITNPTTTPTINLSGTPNIAASNVTSGILPVARGGTNVAAPTGVYTPTLTNVTNLDASTAYQCQWLRIDNVVVVSGKVDVDPTAGGVTALGISLPVSANLGAAEDCGGTAFASGIAGQGMAIRGDAANNRAEMAWIAVDTTNQPTYFSFMYRIP